MTEIHEFSTGIRYQLNSDGSWVSLGFTGQYINVTIDEIPLCVIRSIANKKFAVSEGASSEKPAIIGRVVVEDEDGYWSVVALVTKGWDEKGRSAFFYRYFLSEGSDKLPYILAWIEDYKKQHKHQKNQLPVFNPAETKSIGQSHSFSGSIIKGKSPSEFLNASIPILIPASEDYALEDIHALAEATEKANTANGQPISWAFNVEALEQPWGFVVIKAGSEGAYQLFKKAIANPPKVRKPVLFDEQALTSAIKSLMGSSTVKRESLETFIKALANKDIKEDYWEELFNSQGAMNALRQNIYGSQMVRLLALRTLVIPTTLTEYLEWLKFDENLNKKKLNQPIITFLQFQSQILPLLSELTDSHLKLTELRQGLEKCRRGWKDYFSLANLFEKIGDYVQEKLSDNQLAILYYKLSAYLGNENGRVSKKLFNKIFPNQNSRQQIWNTVIFKESRKESDIVSKTTVIYLVLFFFAFGATLGGAGGYYWGKSDSSPSSSNPIESPDDQKLNSNNSKNLNTTSNNTKTNNQNNQSIAKSNIPPDKQQKAIDKFETDSLIAIKNIIEDIQTSFPTVNRERIIMAFKQNLGDEKLNYDVLWDKNDSQYGKHRDEWIDAIYKYQIKNELDADGIISPKGKTINLLKEKLTAKFNPTSNSLPTSEPIPATGE